MIPSETYSRAEFPGYKTPSIWLLWPRAAVILAVLTHLLLEQLQVMEDGPGGDAKDNRKAPDSWLFQQVL